MDEKLLRLTVERELSRLFDMEREVRSECGHYRIDLVLQSRRDPDFLFGVEFKHGLDKNGAKFKRDVEQVVKYCSTAFCTKFSKKPAILPVFLCPGLSSQFFQVPSMEHDTKYHDGQLYYPVKHPVHHEHHNLSPVCAVLGFGELRRITPDCGIPGREPKRLQWAFIFNNMRVWSEDEGVRQVMYDSMIKHINQ